MRAFSPRAALLGVMSAVGILVVALSGCSSRSDDCTLNASCPEASSGSSGGESSSSSSASSGSSSGAPAVADGEPCPETGECESKRCVDGVCCATDCGLCQACNIPGKEGTCSTVPGNKPDPDTCGGVGDETMACSAGGECKTALDAPCVMPDECVAGVCFYGYCKLMVGDACNNDENCISNLCAAGACKSCDVDADCHGTKCKNDQPSHFCLHKAGGFCLANDQCDSNVCDTNAMKCL